MCPEHLMNIFERGSQHTLINIMTSHHGFIQFHTDAYYSFQPSYSNARAGPSDKPPWGSQQSGGMATRPNRRQDGWSNSHSKQGLEPVSEHPKPADNHCTIWSKTKQTSTNGLKAMSCVVQLPKSKSASARAKNGWCACHAWEPVRVNWLKCAWFWNVECGTIWSICLYTDKHFKIDILK